MHQGRYCFLLIFLVSALSITSDKGRFKKYLLNCLIFWACQYSIWTVYSTILSLQKDHTFWWIWVPGMFWGFFFFPHLNSFVPKVECNLGLPSHGLSWTLWFTQRWLTKLRPIWMFPKLEIWKIKVTLFFPHGLSW